MAPRVFRAPEGPAAREARRPHYVRCRVSKPARALRSLRRPPHQWGLVADVCLYVGSKPGQASPPPINVARNSPATCSNIEFASLELQCFWGVSKNDRVKLRAKFGRWWCRCCPWVSQPGPAHARGHRSQALRCPSCQWGLVCCYGWPRLCPACGIKFALRGFLLATAVLSSPCARKTCQFGSF